MGRVELQGAGPEVRTWIGAFNHGLATSTRFSQSYHLHHQMRLPLSCSIAAALVGDLGRLTIKNSFMSVKDDHGVEVATKGGIPAVVDVMEVSIESVKLSR